MPLPFAIIPALVGAFNLAARCGGGTLLRSAFAPAAMGVRLGMAPNTTAADQNTPEKQEPVQDVPSGP